MRIQKRNIVTAVILSLVTCGIYGIFWNIQMAKEAIRMKNENESYVLEAVLMLFLPFVGYFLVEKKFTENCKEQGIAHDDSSIIYLILGIIFPIADYCLFQNSLNKAADGQAPQQ